MNKWQVTLLFLGDLTPLFLIGFLFSIDPFHEVQFYFFLTLIIFSVLGSVLWLITIRKINSNKFTRDSRKDNKQIYKIEERGSIYTVYMVTYVSIIPLLSDSLSGLIAFGIIILIVYSIYINSDMLFYNPVLALFGYKFYRIEIGDSEKAMEEDLDEIYVISKVKLTRKNGADKSRYSFYSITDYTYYVS